MAARETCVFGGGVPTAPDVKRLIDEIGVPSEGDVVKYSVISKVIGTDRKAYRWGTVVSAWKKRLYKEHNLVLIAEENVGFRVCDPSERIDVSRRKVRSGFRAVRIGSDVAGKTDRWRLSVDEKKQQDRLSMIAAQITLAQRTQPKELPMVEE